MKYKLSDCVEIISGGTPKKAVSEYWDGNIPWITIKDFGSKYPKSTDNYITQEGLNHSAAKLSKDKDILISARGTVGEVMMVHSGYTFNQSIYGLRIKEKVAIPEYIYYWLLANKQIFIKNVHGSVFDTITRKIFDHIQIELPCIANQAEIVSKLNSIDSKIALNELINDNLLELLDTEFFYRFINNSYSSTGIVSDYVSVKRGASPRPIKNFLSKTGRPWIKISDVTKLTSPFLYDTAQFINKDGISKSRTIVPGTLILSNSATPGIPIISEILASVHDGWLIIDDYTYMNKEWFYLFFRQMRRQLISRANGSVFNNLKVDIVKNFPVPFVTNDKLMAFEKLTNPIFKKLKHLQQENIELNKIKNILLNKYF